MSRTAAGLPSDKARAMASLYVHGPPGVKGDWNKAARAAGYSRAPREDNATIRKLIADFDAGLVEDAAVELQELFGDVNGLSWEELAERARPVFAKIAAGTMFATAQQVTALKELLARGEGRAGAKSIEAQPVGVVVLPVLGSGTDSKVCPVCVNRLLEEAKGSH